MAFILLTVILSLLGFALSRPQNTGALITPDEPVDVTHNACGNLVVAAEQGYTLFWAYDVFECLRNVPFDPAVATRFLKYYNETLQFQSTLAYLKNPPEGYQQPPVDVAQELQNIQDKVNSGFYTSQYVFEADVQLLVNRMHDAHVYLSAGIIAPFAFVSPYGLVSASPDGKAPPAIYFQSDVVFSRLQGWEPSPVAKINGRDIVEYLTEFAELNSEGYLEPHADWNAMFESPVRDILGGLSVLQAATFYPGDELNYEFANGTPWNTYWLATYSEAQHTGPLTTAGDFYNYFVLGLLPEGYTEGDQWWPDEVPVEGDEGEQVANVTEPDYGCSSGEASDKNWCLDSSGAFPNDPVVFQDDLAVTGGGVVTAYYLEDIDTGILSLPSFWQTGNDTQTYFQAVDQFISRATELNVSRVIVDLQQNEGGLNLLAMSTFKRFFYSLHPDTSSRMRAHDLANKLGKTYSEWWDSMEVGGDGADNDLYQIFAGSDWIATNRINPETGRNFSSWDEFFGPVTENGDSFTLTQAYNLTDEIFDGSAFDGYAPFGYGEDPAPAPGYSWAPEDIVLLTDGLCSSACAYFVELMTQAGVKTVVVGGRPTTGPMQTASGNRGARLYSGEALDYDLENINDVLARPDILETLPSREDKGMWINFAGINLKDQLREGDDLRIPLQFRYEAADCRLYYTLDNVYNMTRLWRDVAAAAWEDPSLCVEDSTGYAARPDAESPPKQPPPRTAQAPEVTFTLGDVETPDHGWNTTLDLINRETKRSISSKDVVLCNRDRTCGGSARCENVPVVCPDGKTTKHLPVCLARCTNRGAACNDGMKCDYTQNAVESKSQLPARGGVVGQGGPRAKYERVTVLDGYCKPKKVDPHRYPNLGCPA